MTIRVRPHNGVRCGAFSRVVRLGATAFILLAGAVPVGFADDWPQFRHDAQRTAASKDRVVLPLVEVWNYDHHTIEAVWRGRAFRFTRTPRGPLLVCEDARTGVVMWRQPAARPLWGTGRTLGVSLGVSASGILYVCGLQRVPGSIVRGRPVTRTVGTFKTEEISLNTLQAYDARSGRPLAKGDLRAVPSTPLLLQDGPHVAARVVSQQLLTSPSFTSMIEEICFEPLVLGDELVALSTEGAMVRWSSGIPQVQRVLHPTPPPRGRARTPWNAGLVEFADHAPLVATSAGLFTAGVWTSGHSVWGEFVGLAAPGGATAWHRDGLHSDSYWAMVAADTRNGLIFVVDRDTLLALDATSGLIRWSHRRPSSRSNPIGARMLIVAGGRLLYYVGGSVCALEPASGKLLWEQRLGATPILYGLIASADHVFGNDRDRLFAFRLGDGRLEWAAPGFGPPVAIANGMLYTATQALAPAERRFLLALDSPRPGDYPPEAPPKEGEGADLAASHAARDGPAPPPVRSWLADATILNLAWDEEPVQLLQLARQRVKAARGAPMLLQMDWLDAERDRLLAPGAPASWTAAATGKFVDVCRRVAAAVQPDYFDIAPELNVFLARRPDQVENVLELMRSARRAIQGASPRTKVLVSFNCEVMQGIYGKGEDRPFGTLNSPPGKEPLDLRPLIQELDAVGLTSHPQSAFRHVREMPGDYLLAARRLVGDKPLLVTGIRVKVPERDWPPPRISYLRRMLQLCYWLDAELVVYPEVIVEEKEKELAARAREPDHPALGTWDDVLSWKRVGRLSAAPQPGEMGP